MTWWQRTLGAMGIHVLTAIDPPTFDAELAREGRYVFFHDDDVSRMDAVVRWLRASFDLSAKDAAVTMACCHQHGFGVVGPLEPEEVRRRLIHARWEATRLGLDGLRFSPDPP